MKELKIGPPQQIRLENTNSNVEKQTTLSQEGSTKEPSSWFNSQKMRGPHFVFTPKNGKACQNEKELDKWFKVKNIKPHKLNLEFNPNASRSEWLHKIVNTIAEMRNLELSVSNSSAPNDNDMLHFSKALKGGQNLKRFSFEELNFSSQLTDKGYRKIAKAIEYLRHLTAFNLVLNPKDDTKQGLVELVDNIKQLAHLTQLSIDFPFAYQLNSSVIVGLANAIKRLTKLTEFTFHIAMSNSLDQQTVSRLANSIKQLDNLKHLNLAFNTTGFSEQNLSNLINPLKQLTKLTHLSLDLNSNQNLTDKNVKELAISLANLSNLAVLSLNLSYCRKVKDESIIELASNLKFLNLKSISLNFSGIDNITNHSLSSVAAAISSQSELINCNIDISGCSIVDEASIVGLIPRHGDKLSITY